MKKRPKPVPQLEEEILEEDRAAQDSNHLSASGHAFRIKGNAGMYEVSSSGMTLESPGAQVPRGPVQLRCHYSDLDIENGRLLGSGASGKVFAVKHIPSGVWLALKKINVGEPEQMQQIQRELDTLYADSNDYIIGFYGAFFDHGNIMIALELMDGCLSDTVKHMSCVPETVIRGITRQVLHGLLYLHKELHVVHRDLKPSNILFARDGSIKITDFGISAALQSTLMQANTFIGTVLFMSPERLSGGSYSYPADVWALGLTLLQLASGRHPFARFDDQASFWDVLKCIEDQEPPSLPTDQIYSSNFRTFIGMCMPREPEKRATVLQLMTHPFIADMSDADARAVCMEWFPQVRKKMKLAEVERRAQAQRNIDLAEQLLATGF